MDFLTTIILMVIALIASMYLVAKRKFSFWEGTNYPFIKPSFPYGSLQGLMTKVHISDKTAEFYRQMKGKGPFGGLYITFNPGIIALDLDFIKTVLVREFNHFQDHGIYYNEQDDPLSAHLFAIDGKKWRPQRAKLTPTFTSGKMKFMFPTMLDVATKFKRTLNGICNGGGRDVEIKDLISRFTTDVIGSCAFGIECNSLTDPKAKFKVMGRRAFEDPRHSFFVQFLMGSFPNLARLFRMKVNKDDIAEFFMQTVKFNIAHREINHIRRNDFMDLLIQMKNNGEKVDNENNAQTFSVEEIAAQSFLFFLAGFETSSTAISLALYELAQQPDLQQKARKEIQSVLARHPAGLTYEAIAQMDYVDAIIYESLRKYPPVGVIFRKVTKDYIMPDSNFKLTEGMAVWIPIHAIQNDPEYYPEPEKFDPDRFSPENAKERDPMTFLAFGDGPRACLGMRFGMMQARIGLITLLLNYDFSVCGRTFIPLKFTKKDLLLTPEGGIWLKIRKIK